MSRRKKIMDAVDDLVSAFLYYDRKEDEELGRGEIQKAIAHGEVTVDEIVEWFRSFLVKGEVEGVK